mmetsp:Transcript_5666/g.12345  ORF Transcript_5666/g.12345 Transcript_5666/m.12345 type:complete len:226 (-) Transcript_5666:116-793(-)
MEPYDTTPSGEANSITHPAESFLPVSRTRTPKPARYLEPESSSRSEEDPTLVDLAEPSPLRKSKNNCPRSSTCLGHLDLGDVGTSRDMLECDPNRTWEAILSLQKHDFAFVLRSDGRWTYAILAEKRAKSMRFVVSLKGTTKTITKSKQLDSIRLVNNVHNLEKINNSSRQKLVKVYPPGIDLSASLPKFLKFTEKIEQHVDDGCNTLFDPERRESASGIMDLFH